jgi:hypothetical protein
MRLPPAPPGLATGAALALAAAWAFWPLGPTRVPVPEIHQGSPTQVAFTPLDEAAFRLPLWVAPPPPPIEEPPAKEPTPPPFRLQLLALVPEGEGWKALFYDPEKDKIVSAREGESLAGATVSRIVPTGRETRVVVTDGKARSRTLALREPPPVLPEPKHGAGR